MPPPPQRPLWFCADHWFILEVRQGIMSDFIFAVCNNDHCSYRVRLGRSYRRGWWMGK